MKILIIDPKCPKPYDNKSINSSGLGGTEATIIKIASELAKKNIIIIAQHNRKDSYSHNNYLHYINTERIEKYTDTPDIIIFIQKPQNIRQLTIKYPKARKLLWLHNYLEEEVPTFTLDLLIYNIEIICVSGTHKKHTINVIKKNFLKKIYFTYLRKLKVHYIYNPIDDNLTADNTPITPNKLVFFSSPYKGIENVIRIFSLAKKDNVLNNLKLYIANPGYIRNFDTCSLDINGIINIGSLPQKEVIHHIRSAFCIFYPQIKRPETFGLIYAEANAVGTPVLSHDFGSAREILNNPEQIIDCTDDFNVINTLKSWYEKDNRPRVEANPEFYISNVIKKWNALLSL